MSVVSVKARSFILALFIRDDGERFLLGDNGYDFKGSQLHFSANTIENDEVQKQGADGVMVAGQVRRASVQSFDGYVGDATMAKETIEQMRRDFFAFFVKGHHFRVIYVDCNRNAWQRKGGYLVDAPEVKELWQIHPEYHVGLNFEDVNYYSYDEDADGEEILSNLVDVPVSTAASGGLVWDEDGAVSEDAEVEYDTETAGATGKAISISDAAEAPLSAFKLDGETSQNGTPTPSAPVAVNTTTGENVVQICGKNLFNINGSFQQGFLGNNGNISYSVESVTCIDYIEVKQNTTYAISYSAAVSGSMFRGVCFYDANEAFISRRTSSSGLPDSFTTPSNTRYMRVYFYNADGMTVEQLPSYITNIQIELGSTATPFEPYQEQSYPISLGSIELCKIGDYQDYIYKSDGKWYVHKAVGKAVYSSSDFTLANNDNYTNVRYAQFTKQEDNIQYGNYDHGDIVNYFSSARNMGGMPSGGWDTFNAEGEVYNNATRTAWWCSFAKTTSLDTIKAKLDGMAVYYVLATPTDSEITNQALITQLEAVLAARTYAGTNNIFTITPNEQGTLEVGYYTKYQPIVVGGGYVWEAGGAGGATIVVNNSIDNVNPIWKIYGPTMNPQLENSTTGEVIEYVGLIAEGQTLTIDMGEQTASLDGLNVISNLVGDYISLAPGANRLIYSVSGDAGASEIGWSEIVG